MARGRSEDLSKGDVVKDYLGSAFNELTAVGELRKKQIVAFAASMPSSPAEAILEDAPEASSAAASAAGGVNVFSAEVPLASDPIAQAQHLISEARIAPTPEVPLLLITAPIGSGKSPLARQIAGSMRAVLIEKDLLNASVEYKKVLASKILGEAADAAAIDELVAKLKEKPEDWCAACLNKGLPVVLCNTAVERAPSIILDINKGISNVFVVPTILNLCLNSDADERLTEEQRVAARFLAAVGTLKESQGGKEDVPKHVQFSGGLNPKAPLANLLQTLITSSKEVPVAEAALSITRAEIEIPLLRDTLDQVASLLQERAKDPKQALKPEQISFLWEKASVFNKNTTRYQWNEALVAPVLKDLAKYKGTRPSYFGAPVAGPVVSALNAVLPENKQKSRFHTTLSFGDDPVIRQGFVTNHPLFNAHITEISKNTTTGTIVATCTLTHDGRPLNNIPFHITMEPGELNGVPLPPRFSSAIVAKGKELGTFESLPIDSVSEPFQVKFIPMDYQAPKAAAGSPGFKERAAPKEPRDAASKAAAGGAFFNEKEQNRKGDRTKDGKKGIADDPQTGSRPLP